MAQRLRKLFRKTAQVTDLSVNHARSPVDAQPLQPGATNRKRDEQTRHIWRSLQTNSRQQAQLINAIEKLVQDREPEATAGTTPAPATPTIIRNELDQNALASLDKLAAAVRSSHLLAQDQAGFLKDVRADMRSTLKALESFAGETVRAHRQQVESSTALLAQCHEAIKAQRREIIELQRQQDQASYQLEQQHEARLHRYERSHRTQIRVLIGGSVLMATLLLGAIFMLIHTLSSLGEVPMNAATTNLTAQPNDKAQVENSDSEVGDLVSNE